MRLRTAIATLCLTAFTSATSNNSYIATDQTQNAFNDTHFCKVDRNDHVSPSCNVTFNELNAINENIRDDLSALLKSDFFKYFRLDLYKQCSFWDANDGLCLNRACSVDVVEDWDTLPEYWQPEILGSFNNDTMKEADDSDDECKFLDQLCQTSKKPVDIEDTINYCDVNDFNGKKTPF
ncbi:Endoplasmic Reticulum Oxidoreductin 1 (ERO1) family protein [Saccharomyces cerevisiae]|nr:Endoplasmic Reticulum Oxidoreductin 1 (ERO1) family protein [Saccharomyces cerevisiae]